MNPILDKILAVVENGKNPIAVIAKQQDKTSFEVTITLQDGEEEGNSETNRTFKISATSKAVEEWMEEVTTSGQSKNLARYEYPDYTEWVTEPLRWRRL